VQAAFLIFELIIRLMKQYLKKHQWQLIFGSIFLILVLYFAAKQKDFYLEDDIETFKTQYLQPGLIVAGFGAFVVILVLSIIKIRPFIDAMYATFYLTAMTATLLFIFQNLFLAGTLFLNRQFNRGSITRAYVANYTIESDTNKKNFFPYDASSKYFPADPKLKERLYYPGLKPNDTITLHFEKGLLGILYTSSLQE
jgi:hypothetical protein